jgi:hypothetical protein
VVIHEKRGFPVGISRWCDCVHDIVFT